MNEVSKAKWTAKLPGYIGVAVVLFVLGAILYPRLVEPEQRGYSAHSCQNNLRILGATFREYAGDTPGERFPQLSNEPGNLSFDPKVILPKYLDDPNILVCTTKFGPPPSRLGRFWHSITSGEKAQAKVPLQRALYEQLWYTRPETAEVAVQGLVAQISDTSYFYLGYVISSDEQLAAFAEVYKERIATKLAFDVDLPAPAGKGTGNGDTFYLLREGIERFMITDINNAAASAKAQSELPVLIERTGAHRSARGGAQGGGNVLFMDGHVAFQVVEDNPDAFPMTPRSVKILAELDALGPPPAF